MGNAGYSRHPRHLTLRATDIQPSLRGHGVPALRWSGCSALVRMPCDDSDAPGSYRHSMPLPQEASSAPRTLPGGSSL